MKKNDLTEKQKKELELFGANTWFVESLLKQYNNNPDEVPEQWRSFFQENGNNLTEEGERKETKGTTAQEIIQPTAGENDETRIIAGSSARILENMTSSLTIPVATSQRSVPVKLLSENRIIINGQLKRRNIKISFTHLICWAILKAVKSYPVMNSAFTITNGKPAVIKRNEINLGLAIDLEKKDGTHSLIVPSIKNAETMGFKQFFEKYEDLVSRSRKGALDPSEFQGTTITLTNPGTIGTVLSVPRLMVGQGTIIATGAIQYPAEYQAMSPSTISALGISKVMGITSTYDHRIIQGAESGLFLKEINDLLLGEKNFYEEIFNDLQVQSQPVKWMTDYQPGGFTSSLNSEEIEKQARVLQLIKYVQGKGASDCES